MAEAAPKTTPKKAARSLWKSVDDFGEEGSRKKERAIAKAILSP